MASGFSTDEEAQQGARLIEMVGDKVGVSKTAISRPKERALQFMRKFKDAPPSDKVSMGTGIFFKYFFIPLFYVAKFYVIIMKYVYKAYKLLPMNVISMVFGAGLCFFGGTYFATIAAIEAFRQFGGELLADELSVLLSEAERAEASIETASKEDLDKDGIADFDQMTYHQRAQATAFVAMRAVSDPMAVQKSMTFLFTSWMSVLAVLKFQFAKTVTLCLAVSEMLEMPCCRLLGPVLSVMLGPDLNKWAYPSISVTVKIIAVLVAVWVQSCISAFYSGLRGGKMFAEGFVNVLTEYGVMEKLPFVHMTDGKFDPDESYFDECIAYPLCAGGVYWQVTNAFSLPFPWSLVLLPLTIVDWIIKIQIFT